MSEEKKKSNKKLFIVYGSSLGLLIASIFVEVFSPLSQILKNSYSFLPWGELVGILSALLIAAVTICSISISLQRETILCFTRKKLRQLKSVKDISYLQIIFVAVALGVLQMIFLFTERYVILIVLSVIEVGFIVVFCIQELPLLIDSEKKGRQIIRTYFNTHNLENVDFAPGNDVAQTVQKAIFQEGFISVYQQLKTDEHQEKLLQVMLDLLESGLSDADLLTTQADIDIVLSKATSAALDLLSPYKFDLREEIAEPDKIAYRFTRIFIKAIDSTQNPGILNQISSYIKDAIYRLVGHSEKDSMVKLHISVLSALVIHTLPSGNVWVADQIARHISEDAFCLYGDNRLIDFFEMLSFYMYYLIRLEPLIPKEAKETIDEFLSKEKEIKDGHIYYNWRELYHNAHLHYMQPKYNGSLSGLLEIYRQSRWDYILFNHMKMHVLDESTVVQWFLLHYLNSEDIYKKDWSFLKNDKFQYETIMAALDEIFTEGGQPKPGLAQSDMISFYDKPTYINSFCTNPDIFSSMFDVKNSLRREQFEKVLRENKFKDLHERERDFKETFCNSLDQVFGKTKLDLSEEPAEIIQSNVMQSEAWTDFYKIVAENYADYIKQNLEKKIEPEIIKFEGKAAELFEKVKDLGVTHQTQRCLRYLINEANDEGLRDEISKFDDGLISVEQKPPIPPDCLFEGDAFKFDYQIEDFRLEELKDEEIERYADEYKQSDGRYLYQGLFVSRDKVTEYIKNQYLSLNIRYKTKLEHGNIYLIDYFGRFDENQDAV